MGSGEIARELNEKGVPTARRWRMAWQDH